YIDLVKMFQLIPGIGAVVGAFVNYNLLDQLGETAMNSYRVRLLNT
ncbi:EcsC family protein, partial [Paenisporosarcina sp. TG20]